MEYAKANLHIPVSLIGRDIHWLVYKMQGLDSEVRFVLNDKSVNAKSLIGMFSAQIKQGDCVEVVCYHEDKQTATSDIERVKQSMDELVVIKHEFK